MREEDQEDEREQGRENERKNQMDHQRNSIANSWQKLSSQSGRKIRPLRKKTGPLLNLAF
jgi:hypothetical protein